MPSVQPYDALMLAILAIATLMGAWKGMAWQVASLVSVGLSYTMALQFGGQVAPYFGDQAPFNRFAGMLAVYVGTSLAVWLFFRLVAGTIERVKLKDFDRQLGALFGAAKGVLICVVVTFFAVTLSSTGRDAVLQSQSGHYIAQLIQTARPVLPTEVRDAIGPYLNRLDEELQQPPGYSTPDTADSETAAPWDNYFNR